MITDEEVPERTEWGGKPPIHNYSEGFFQERVHTNTTLPVTHDRPLVFEIPALSDHVIDTRLLRLYLRFRIVKSNGEILEDDEKLVLPKSAPLYTLFKDVTVFWNNTPVYVSRNMYPFYANVLLQLKLEDVSPEAVMYYDDNRDLDRLMSAKVDEEGERTYVLTSYTGEDKVASWEERSAMAERSAYMEVCGPLLHDLIFQKKFLRDDVSIRIALTPSAPSFSLFATALQEEYQVEIESAFCIVPRMKLAPRYRMPKGKLSYFHVEHNLGIHIIRKDASNVSRPLMSGNVPRRIVLVMLTEDSYQGRYHLSPFSYKHFGLTNLQLQIGERKVPHEPLRPDFANDTYLETYLSFLDNLKESGKRKPISKTEFGDNHFFAVMDCTKDFSAGSSHWSKLGQAPISVQMQFSSPLEENVVLISISEFEKITTVDEAGQVTVKDAPLH